MAVTVKNLSGIRTTRVSLAVDLAVRLKEDILSGRLKKDDKLTEQAVCEAYQVSRTPVREALFSLEAEGLVKIIPNRGAFVVGLSAREMEDIFTLRRLNEVQAVRWAIERITDDEMDELEENFEFMEFYTMKKDLEKMLNINVNFHRMIYRASHNRMLSQLLTSYQIYVRHMPTIDLDRETYLNTLLEEHRRIFSAFRSGDAEAGALAMEDHMRRSRERHRLPEMAE
ncbi:MAG: GntR family transcriptional regulator [Anaerovoracaceae bacterium]|jgi:DNA-binding GntR family transcriptional regulator